MNRRYLARQIVARFDKLRIKSKTITQLKFLNLISQNYLPMRILKVSLLDILNEAITILFM